MWEVRLFSLQTHAMTAGQEVTAEEAIQRVGAGPWAQCCNCPSPAVSLLRQVWHCQPSGSEGCSRCDTCLPCCELLLCIFSSRNLPDLLPSRQ